MDPYENNFLLALHPPDTGQPLEISSVETIPAELTKGSVPPSLISQLIGLAWLDLSTGDFFTQTTTLGTLPSAAARIGAREIVLSDSLEDSLQQSVLDMLEHQQNRVTYHSTQLTDVSMSSWTPMLEAEVPTEMQTAFTNEEVTAGSLLLAYVRDRLQGLGVKLQPPIRRQDKETMSIDRNSMRALEVLGTSKDTVRGGKGSLLHTVRRTVTKSGTRLLRDWIASPSMSLQVINARLDLVSQLLQDRTFREDITNLLRRSYDSQRLVQKFSMGRGDADDLISMLRTIEATNGIANALERHISPSDANLHLDDSDQKSHQSLQMLSRRLSLDGPNALAARIVASIDEDGLTESRRAEESKNGDIISAAQEVLQNEGSAVDQAAMSRVTKLKVKQKASPEPDAEEQDQWILRRRYVFDF